jgi:argininosuccinate synthase
MCLLTLSHSRLAHLDLEGLVMDAQVRDLRDQFVSRAWSRQLYNGLVSPFFSHCLPTVDFIDLCYYSTSALNVSF